MAKQTKRNDLHRVGAIIPTDYTYVLTYNKQTMVDGDTVPAFGINCQLDRRSYGGPPAYELLSAGEHDADGRCCVVGLMNIARVLFAEHGGTGKCTICGAAFVYGDVWRHNPTGEHIHVGHTCAEKYNMLAERGSFDARRESFVRRTAAHRLAEKNREERALFLIQHPGLAEALLVAHPIVKDIHDRFIQYRALSDKQIALVRRIADQVNNPVPKVEEKNVPAPIGRTTVIGKIVSLKLHDGDFGPSMKMTVKVTTDAGTWLAWGTCPESILEEGRKFIAAACVYATEATAAIALRGAEVQFDAALKPGREAHFALLSRPTKAKVLAFAPPPDAVPAPSEVAS